MGGSCEGAAARRDSTEYRLTVANWLLSHAISLEYRDACTGGDLQAAATASGKGGGSVAWDKSLPLGVKLKDQELTDAVRAMRLLFVNDLRDLQSSVDDLTIQVQEVTANPRVNASLGRVGV